MNEPHTIQAQRGLKANRATKGHDDQQFWFGNILKTINANFELLLLITVLISILVT
ncbi:hypothetical protein ACV07N_06320 [Roseivirga echinicomitans]